MQFLPPLEALPLNHPRRERVEKTFGLGRFHRLEHRPEGPAGSSYWTVADIVAARGGRSVLGWRMLLWPGLVVMAQHFAVWESPDGKWIDVTEKEPTDKQPFTTFIADPRAKIDLEKPAMVADRYYLLVKTDESFRLLEVLTEQFNAKQALHDKLVAAGVSMKPNAPFEAPEELVDELNLQNAHMRKVLFAMDACADLPKVSPLVSIED